MHRSPHPAASTAIGLAIAVDDDSGYRLDDRVWRGFGVFREADGGRSTTFDPIIATGTPLPHNGHVEVVRQYRARHTHGEYRFTEYSRLDADGMPHGELAPWTRVLFPFTDEDATDDELSRRPAVRTDSGPLVEERYRVDPAGLVDVTISNLDSGFRRQLRLGR